MTLIIAGFNKGGLDQGSLYFATDSVITTPYCGLDIILIKGFKKVVEIPIRIMRPTFINGFFHSYGGYLLESKCVVAFAGNTLVSQHLMNSITNHLSKLYPSYSNNKYQLVMNCEAGLHSKPNSHYDVDGEYGTPMFTDEQMHFLGSAEYYSEVVEHSINAVLQKVKTYTDMKTDFGPYKAEFILGVYCHQKLEHQLYMFEIVKDNSLDVVVKKHKIDESDIALIGDKSFKEDALEAISKCPDNDEFMRRLFNIDNDSSSEEKIESNALRADALAFDFLNSTIDTENSTGNIKIGRPSVLFNFDRGFLERRAFVG